MHICGDELMACALALPGAALVWRWVKAKVLVVARRAS